MHAQKGIFAASLIAAFLCAGTALAKAAPPAAVRTCAACHGQQGQGNPAAGFPRLAGLPAAYIERELAAFADGTRKNATMQPIAKGLDAAEIKTLARYYAGLKTPPVAPAPASAAELAAGRDIAVNGLWQKSLPSCMACHGPGARGIAPTFPPLAGQNAQYIEAQLKDWQAGKRPGGPVELMKHVADALDAGQIKAVAAYLATLPATGKLPASAAPDVAPMSADAMPGYFQPPLEKDLPTGAFGKTVKRGYLIFTQTPKYADDYIGNAQSCSNCHTNRGRQANAAPMWAAWGMYPTYRKKNHKVNDFVMRLQGCFRYSENAPGSKTGHPPAGDSPVMIALESYIYWMSHKVPTGVAMKGRGYPHLKPPPQPFSRDRGEVVYARNCAVCHGPNGEGRKLANGEYAFPPLWGPRAFNWGAGMHRVNTAADFIRANMPLGKPGSLSLQQTWDVAAWIDSHPRPQDPRYNGSLGKAVKQFHANRAMDFYGKKINGLVLGAPETLAKWNGRIKAEQSD